MENDKAFSFTFKFWTNDWKLIRTYQASGVAHAQQMFLSSIKHQSRLAKYWVESLNVTVHD